MLEPGTKSANTYHVHESDHNNINLGRVSDNVGNHHVGNMPRKAAQNYANYRSWDSMGTLSAGTDHGKFADDDESGFCSPPLWRTSPSSSPQHRKNHYRSLSPASKAQAIARGQRELMEMVSKMPESCYELSLRDLVEHPMVEVKQESFREEKDGKLEDLRNRRDQKGVRRSDHKKVQMKRNGSLNNNSCNSNEGFLLKMVFPIAFGSKKAKKKTDLAVNNSSKVSPKSPVNDGSDKGVDKEWWKKRFSVSSESESAGSSSNNGSGKSTTSSSSSSDRSSGRHGDGGCWSFIRTRKSIKAP